MQSQENVMKMLEMRNEGKKLAEIGQHFGISRQRVYQIIGGDQLYSGRPIKSCTFPGITNWLRCNSVSVKKMSENLNMCRSSLFHKLWGNARFTLPEIKEILAYTGMTFEEAFGEEIKPTEEK